MVSLSRLLAAAADAPLDERPVSSLPIRLPRDCVIPPSIHLDSVSPTLRVALSSPDADHTSQQPSPSPSLPLQLLLSDLGPEATAPRSMSVLARALAHFGRPSEAAVASALLFLTTSVPQDMPSEDSHTSFHLFSLFCSHPDNPSLDPSVQQAVNATNSNPLEWRPDVFVQAVTAVATQFNAPLDWRLIIRSFDMDGLNTRLTRTAFVDIAKAYMTGNGGNALPADCLVNNWHYTAAQLCMLKHALLSPSLINWDVLDAFDGATPDDLNSPYARVSLVEKLVELDAYDLLHDGIKGTADALLLSLACAKPRNNATLQQKLTVSLLTPLIAAFPTSKDTLRKMWNVTPALVEAGIINMWKKDAAMLHQALSISLDLHILPELLSTGTLLEFSLELAMLAYRRDVLKLESWLTELLVTRGLPAVSICTIFLAQKVRSGGETSAAMQLSVDAVRIIFRCLVSAIQKVGGSQAQELMEGIREVLEAYAHLNPRISDLNPSSDLGDHSVLVSSDIGILPPSGPMPGSMPGSMAASMPLPVSAPTPIPTPVSASVAPAPSALDMASASTLVGVSAASVSSIPGMSSIVGGSRGDVHASGVGGDGQIPHHTLVEESASADAASTAAAMLYPMSNGRDGSSGGFADDVDKEADVFFQKLYRGEMPPEQAVDRLRHLKSSQSVEERQVFNCALHTLFDEYRFFLKYPDRELKITGMLFGSVIQHSLIQGTILGLAIRCVLDALRTVEPAPHPIGRYAKFGLCALERFRARLYEWPQYCSHILDITRLKAMAPELITEVRKALLAASASPPTDVKNIIVPAVDSDTTIDALLGPDDGAPPPATVTDPSDSANNVTSLLASPVLSATHTPVKTSMSSSSLRASPSLTVDGALGLSSINLITMLGMTADEAGQILEPDVGTQGKIKFIFNNLSRVTMDDKVKEMIEILRPEHQHFFSIYIVVKRASSESNFHHLYITMLDMVEPHLPALFRMVFDTSYRRVRVLLSGDKIKMTSSERSILKSLGSWIGSLTIARNIPILRRDLDMKELLMHAYSNGRLTTLVPFVSRVLEACTRSKIFKTTNPWVRGILSLMKEIYCVDDLKLNMKFELQLLCKTLTIDVSDVSPSDLLRGRPAPNKSQNPDFTTKKQPGSSPPRTSPSPTASPSPELSRPYLPTGPGGRPGVPIFTLTEAQSAAASHPIPLATGQPPVSSRLDVTPSLVSGNLSMGGDIASELSSILVNTSIGTNVPTGALQRNPLHAQGTMSIPSTANPAATQRAAAAQTPSEPMLLPNLSQYIQISPSLVLFQTSPQLKRAIPVAIDRAIREIIQPVVERSCAIAFLTTKELTLKDFAGEPDMGQVRRAALQMVQQLAGSLALVTSKEPLRVSMGNQLRILLTPPVGADQNLIEQTAQMVCASNLDVGCAIIERHAKEKAARDLSDKIGPAFANRRPNPSDYPYAVVPGPEVHRTYDEFSRLHRVTPSPSQYETSQTISPTTHSIHQSQVASTAPVTVAMPANHLQQQSRLMQNMPEHRVNGAGLEPKVEPRAIPTQLAPTQLDPTQLAPTQLAPSQLAPQQPVAHVGVRNVEDSERMKSMSHTVAGPRRASASPPPSEGPAALAVYGTALPVMASPTSVAAAILAAAGSSNTSGGNSSHGFSSTGGGVASVGEEALSTPQVLERFNSIYPQIVALISEIVTAGAVNLTLADLSPEHELHSLWTQIPACVKRSITADEAGMAVAQKVFKGLYEGGSALSREVHVLILDGLRESCRRLSKELSSWLAFSEDRKKFHKDCIVALMKAGGLLNITAYDEVLAKSIDNGRNSNALEFACFLVERAVIEEPLATAAEMYVTLETMLKIGRRGNGPSIAGFIDGLLGLVDSARSVTHRPIAGGSSPSSSATLAGSEVSHGGVKGSKDMEPTDHTGAREYVAGLLLEWQRIICTESATRPVGDHVVVMFLNQIRNGIVGSEESRERFFRLAIELVCTVTRSALQSREGVSPIANDLVAAPYTIVETTVRLIGCLCRDGGDGNGSGSGSGNGSGSGGGNDNGRDVVMLCEFLSALVKDVLKHGENADLRAHFRLFSGLIAEFTVGSSVSSMKDMKGTEFTAVSETYFNNMLADRLGLIESKTDGLRFMGDVKNGFIPFVRNSVSVIGGQGVGSDERYNVQVLSALVGALSACGPSAAPGFVFCWLQLISNKELLPRLLSLSTTYGWPLFRHLIVKMLEFVCKFLGEGSVGKVLPKGICTLYSGLLRVLLVLLHDFPEFLCAYHIALCNAIPTNCVQLRNLVLASFPKDMRLPDPFMPELNVEDLPDMAQQPLILSDYLSPIQGNGVKTLLMNYLQRQRDGENGDVNHHVEGGADRDGDAQDGEVMMTMVKKELLNMMNESIRDSKYCVRLMGSIVMYVGQYAIGSGSQLGDLGTGVDLEESNRKKRKTMHLFRTLIRELGAEGRHYLLNAIANQLRYPNNNTLYYSNLMLLLFDDADDDCVKEQITRVLVERLIANRPHPWGLLITFVQLIKNSEYNFWAHSFVRCAPEIEQLFENVAKFCVGPVAQQSNKSQQQSNLVAVS